MRTSLKTFAGIAAAGSLMVSLAACTPASNTSAAPASSSTASASSAAAAMPKPLASIPALTGTSTAVKLDASFAKALETLKLT
ncbi:hypothetical protein ABIB26_004805, partial [Arthrobacter sp. UYEF20]